jgi:hypothetical protein
MTTSRITVASLPQVRAPCPLSNTQSSIVTRSTGGLDSSASASGPFEPLRAMQSSPTEIRQRRITTSWQLSMSMPSELGARSIAISSHGCDSPTIFGGAPCGAVMVSPSSVTSRQR